MADPVLQSPTNQHFFQPLLPGFYSYLNIPVAFFSKYLQGRNKHNTAKLRSDASDTAWEVEIDDDRRLTGDWKEFVTAHDFRIGDVIVFRHEGDLGFHVTAFEPSCCEVEYKSSHNDNDDQIEIRPLKKKAKKNPRRQEDSSFSDNSCFIANVSPSNIYNDRLCIPVSFARSNGLSKTYGKIVLLNEKGRSWKLTLDHDKIGIKTFIKQGWRSFCHENGMKQGRYTFKLVQNSGTPVIRLCQAEDKPDSEASPGSSCFVGSVSPSSLRRDSLYLPRGFVNSNGLKKRCGEMILKNEDGGTWNLVLKHCKTNNSTYITRGWRSFCQVNGINARDYFRFKLVKTGEKPVLCLYPAETHTRLEECSVETDVNSLSTDLSSGEESSETDESEEKKSLGEHCSKPGASSLPRQNRFVTLTITPYSVRTNKMRLPVSFTRANGIKTGKIAMLGPDGENWMVHVMKDGIPGRMRLGRGWKGFCEVQGVKFGESFVLECIKENYDSPFLKFCTKVNCV